MDIGLWGKLIAGGVLGLGLVWVIWRKFAKSEAVAVENAGLKAAQDVDAEARAAESAIRAAAKKAGDKAGPVAPSDWRFVVLVGFLGSLALSSCGDLKPFGVSRWPPIDVPAPLEYTPEEQVDLAEFSAKHPALARKIVNQAQALRAAIDEYNRRAWDVNAKQLKALGYAEKDVERLLGKKDQEAPSAPPDPDAGAVAGGH